MNFKMRLTSTKEIPMSDITRMEPKFDPCINIFQRKDIYNKEGSARDYIFQGVLPSDTKKFYLIFKKEDEQDLPLAVPFELRDDYIVINQYHYLRPTNEHPDHMIIQFPDSELSQTFVVEVSPSFPYPLEIYGEIKLQ